ncbi:hypothetical protein LZ31DRAFT_218520 [Colletotrichum somersetense]|nr:hypothetical protein LZ31DRAFT_218520 [Colletotrichum somersetense]
MPRRVSARQHGQWNDLITHSVERPAFVQLAPTPNKAPCLPAAAARLCLLPPTIRSNLRWTGFRPLLPGEIALHTTQNKGCFSDQRETPNDDGANGPVQGVILWTVHYPVSTVTWGDMTPNLHVSVDLYSTARVTLAGILDASLVCSAIPLWLCIAICL